MFCIGKIQLTYGFCWTFLFMYLTGSDNYMVVTDATQQHISVFSLKQKTFVCTRQVFTDDAKGDPLTVDAMTISADERQVFYCDCYTNDLHIADINTLKDVKVHKGKRVNIKRIYHII